jgi:putative FmdB family regulatory protein
MPIYAYKCGSCGHAKDVLQKLSDAPLSVCPACSQPAFSKQVTAAGFQLKGSGWYVTDFRGGSQDKPAAGGASAAGGVDTKPASSEGSGSSSESNSASSSKAPSDSSTSSQSSSSPAAPTSSSSSGASSTPSA